MHMSMAMRVTSLTNVRLVSKEPSNSKHSCIFFVNDTAVKISLSICPWLMPSNIHMSISMRVTRLTQFILTNVRLVSKQPISSKHSSLFFVNDTAARII